MTPIVTPPAANDPDYNAGRAARFFNGLMWGLVIGSVISIWIKVIL